MAKKKYFDPNKPPRLISGESASSFRERVKNWEEVTGKKATYGDALMSKSKENRILQGEGLLGMNTDYTRREDYIDSYNRERTKKRLREDPSGSTDKEQDDKAYEVRSLYGMDKDVDPGDLMGLTALPTQDEIASLKAQSDERLAATTTADNTNSWMPQNNPLVTMHGDQLTYLGQEKGRLRQKFITEDTVLNNSITELNELNTATNNNYVTDYQTAIQNSRRDGLSFGDAKQYYGEDVLDSAGQRVRKSNVFTVGEDGDPMGVMTRRQRLAIDLANQEAKIPKPDTADNKKEDTSTEIKTEPNVGSEIKNTGEGGKVFTPPNPLSDEYKSLFSPSRA